jgi:wobble nucleotide-excising tRNase
VSGYIKEKLDQKKKIDEEIKQANEVLQSKNVNIETINEHIRLSEKLNEYSLSFHDTDKLLNVLINAKEKPGCLLFEMHSVEYSSVQIVSDEIKIRGVYRT